MTWKLGKDLRIYDKIKVWWSSNTVKPNEDVITEIEKLENAIFKNGCATAKFLSGVKMTIDFGEYYEVIGPSVKDLCDPAFTLPPPQE